MQYDTLRCITVQYSTVQYSTVQYSTVQYSTVQYRVHVLDAKTPSNPHESLNILSQLPIMNWNT